MGGVLLLVIARMLLGLIDSIQQEHKRRKQKRREKRQQKKNVTQQSGLCSTMCCDIANDAVDTTQVLIQSQQRPDKPAGGSKMVYASIIVNRLSTSAGSYISELLAAGGKKEYVECASTYAIAECKAMHELEHDVSKLDYQVYALDYSVAHATEAKYEQDCWTDAGRYCKSI